MAKCESLFILPSLSRTHLFMQLHYKGRLPPCTVRRLWRFRGHRSGRRPQTVRRRSKSQVKSGKTEEGFKWHEWRSDVRLLAVIVEVGWWLLDAGEYPLFFSSSFPFLVVSYDLCIFVVLVGTGGFPDARGEFWVTLVVAFPATGKTF